MESTYLEVLANECQHPADPLAEGGKMCRRGHSPGLIETRKETLEIGQSRVSAVRQLRGPPADPMRGHLLGG